MERAECHARGVPMCSADAVAGDLNFRTVWKVRGRREEV